VPVTVAGTPQPGLSRLTRQKNYILGGVGSISAPTNSSRPAQARSLSTTPSLFRRHHRQQQHRSPGNIGATALPGHRPIILMVATVAINGYGGAVELAGRLREHHQRAVGPNGTLGCRRVGLQLAFHQSAHRRGQSMSPSNYVRDYFSGNWSAFTAAINVSPRSGTGELPD